MSAADELYPQIHITGCAPHMLVTCNSKIWLSATNANSHAYLRNWMSATAMLIIISVHLPAFGCITTGGLLLGHATHRYHSVQKALLKGKFHLGTSSIFGIVFVSSVLTICSLGIIFSDFDTLEIVRHGNKTVLKRKESV